MTFLSILVLALLTWLQLWAQLKVNAVESNFQPGEVSFLLTLLASRNAFWK